MNSSAFILLLRMQLRQRLSISVIRQQMRDKPDGWWKRAAVGLLAAFGIGSLSAFFAWMVWTLGKTLASVGIERLIPLLGLIAGMTSTLIAGAGFLISVLYLSRDADALASLPVSGRTVFAVKISQAFLGEAATSIPLLWPVFIVYGVLSGGGALYYIKAVVVWLCALSLPLTLSALITLPLMRLSVLWRRRDIAAVVGGLVLMVGFVAGEMWLSSRMASLIDGGVLLMWLAGRVDLFDRIARAIPPVWLGLRALTLDGASALGYLAGLLAVSGALTAAAVWLSGKIYLAGVSAQSESHMNTSRVNFSGRSFKRRAPMIAMMIREAKLTVRTPVYAMNTLSVVIVLPVMLLVVMLAGGSSGDPELAAFVSMLVRTSVDPWLTGLLIAAMSLVIGCMNVAASTAVSREGRMFAWSRVLPVPYGTQAMGKLLFALCLAWLGQMLIALSLRVSMKLPVQGLILGCLISVPAMVPVTTLQLAIDILRPKLLWTNTTEAVKQNMNYILGMLAALAYAALMIVPSVMLMTKARVSAVVIYAVLFAVNAAMAAASVPMLKRCADRGYSAVEI